MLTEFQTRIFPQFRAFLQWRFGLNVDAAIDWPIGDSVLQIDVGYLTFCGEPTSPDRSKTLHTSWLMADAHSSTTNLSNRSDGGLPKKRSDHHLHFGGQVLPWS